MIMTGPSGISEENSTTDDSMCMPSNRVRMRRIYQYDDDLLAPLWELPESRYSELKAPRNTLDTNFPSTLRGKRQSKCEEKIENPGLQDESFQKKAVDSAELS